MSNEDLEKLKKKKMRELKENQAEGESLKSAQDQQEQMKEQLKAIASKILTPEARSRLGNIRAANPDLASQIELQLVQLYKAGQIRDKITDDQLKEMLKSLQSGKERKMKFR